MADTTTGNDLTPEETAAQELEQKNQNQEEAFKRITAENEVFKAEKQEAKDLADAEAKAEADEIAKNENPEKFEKDQIKQELKEELRADIEKEAKVNEVLKEFPQLSEHKDKIEKYLKDDSRKNIPIDEVVAGAIGYKALIKLGADLGSEAFAQAESSKSGGGNAKTVLKTKEEKDEQRHMDSLPEQYKT